MEAADAALHASRLLLALNWLLCAHVHFSNVEAAIRVLSRVYGGAGAAHSRAAGTAMLLIAALLLAPSGAAVAAGGYLGAVMAVGMALVHRFWAAGEAWERAVEEALFARSLGVAAASLAVAALAA